MLCTHLQLCTFRDVNKREINLREARARIGFLVDRAEHAGEVTIITRHGRPAAAIVPISLLPREQTMTATAADITLTLDRSGEDDGWNWTAAALEQWTAAAEQAGLRAEVISTDVPDEAYDAGVVEVDGETYLVSVRNDEITARPVRAYTLTIVEGIQPGSSGSDLGSPESPVQYAELPDEVTDWLTANNFDPDHPDIWVLVTPAGEDPCAVNVIDSRLVVLT